MYVHILPFFDVLLSYHSTLIGYLVPEDIRRQAQNRKKYYETIFCFHNDVFLQCLNPFSPRFQHLCVAVHSPPPPPWGTFMRAIFCRSLTFQLRGSMEKLWWSQREHGNNSLIGHSLYGQPSILISHLTIFMEYNDLIFVGRTL